MRSLRWAPIKTPATKGGSRHRAGLHDAGPGGQRGSPADHQTQAATPWWFSVTPHRYEKEVQPIPERIRP